MARTFEVLTPATPRWVEVPPGRVQGGDTVRVKDDGVVVSAIVPAVAADPQTYIAFTGGTTSPVKDEVGPATLLIGVTVFHPDDGLAVIPLTAP